MNITVIVIVNQACSRVVPESPSLSGKKGQLIGKASIGSDGTSGHKGCSFLPGVGSINHDTIEVLAKKDVRGLSAFKMVL